MAGAMFVWLAPLMVRLTQPDSPIPMTTEDTSWLSAIIEISEGLATIPAGLLADRWGRKPVMLSAGPLVLLSWAIVLTTRSVPALHLVRLIQGLALAVVIAIVPIYLAEIAEPKLRGQICGNFQVFWYIGLLYSYATGPYLDYNTYVWLACCPPALFLACFLFVPESPYYLLMVREEEKAFETLSWLRAGRDIQKEFTEMKASVAEEMSNKGSWKDLIATKKDRRAFIIVQIVSTIKFMSGMSSIVLYATQTFAASSKITLTSDQMTIILAIILIITTLGANFLSDSIGRRPLLIISTIGATIFHSIVAVYYFLDEKTNIDVSSYMWIAYTSLLGFCIITNVGLGPLSMTIQAEYFPSHTRGIGGGITGLVASVVIFVSIKQYQFMVDNFGVYMNYVTFAVISLVGTVVFMIIIRETAGKSLGQIQKTFTSDVGEEINVNTIS
ncbi:facilitated trehalose transporter Tret1-like isoform X3 [Rhodnius prolixus]